MSDHRRSDKIARWVSVAILAFGVLLLIVPAIGTTLDSASGGGPAPLSDTTTYTTTHTQRAGEPDTTSTTTVLQRSPLVDSGIVGRIFAIPGMTFLLRLALILMFAFVGGSFVQGVARARFALHIGPLGLAEHHDAPVTAALATLRHDPQLGAAEAAGAALAPALAGGQADPTARARRDVVLEGRAVTERRYQEQSDAPLALSSLRADLEQRLRLLAQRYGVTARSLTKVVRELQDRKVLGSDSADAILRLIHYGSEAAHGQGRFGSAVLRSIRKEAPAVLNRLDALIDAAPRSSQ